MNTDPIIRTGNTWGQRLRMAAVGVAEAFGAAGLLTVVAVEGGAALHVDTAVVQEAEAGTGIRGTVITGGCNPSSNQPQLTIANNTSGRLDFKASINGGPFEFAGTVEPHNSLTGSAKTGDRYVHTADQIPGAQDTEVIPACGTTTTTVRPTTTTAGPTTTSTSTPAPSATTTSMRNPNTGGSIPGGEVGQPAVTTTNGPTTSSTSKSGTADASPAPAPVAGGKAELSADPNIQTSDPNVVASAPGSAAATGNRQEIVRTGIDINTPLTVAGIGSAIGIALVVLGRRKRQEATSVVS